MYSAYGVWLADRRRDATFSFCVDGSYGDDLSSLLRTAAAPYIFIDVGANIGLYSAIALGSPSCAYVHSVEPDPDSLPYLWATLRHTRADGKFAVHAAALSDRVGFSRLARTPFHSGASTLQQDQSGLTGAEVPLMNGAALAHYVDQDATRTLPIIAKIDVEGHEHAALTSLLSALGQRMALVWIEFSAKTREAECVEALRRHGFRELKRIGCHGHYDALWVSETDLSRDLFPSKSRASSRVA